MNLLIVESPSKAKTIEKYLGSKDWKVIASVGHVRDLVPESGSVDIKNNFAPKWQIMAGKEKQIKLIIDEIKKADAVYLASDPDREGEAIAWHLNDIFNSKNVIKDKNVYRVTFHEITKNAVTEAIKHPREIDKNLVDAYFVRRVLDYLIGFEISPLLWKRNLGKSAGRVQSVAVKLVVDKEQEIENFKPTEYWSIDANCSVNNSKFTAGLINFKNNKIDKMTIENKNMADEILSCVKTPGIGTISQIDKKKTQRKASAPFTTSTLQQEAARKLYFSSKRTMATAQKLYEQGFITYMRTDATNLSVEAVTEIREYINKEYGQNFLPKTPNIYVTKSKNAQEAHEAIRPTHFLTEYPSHLTGDEAKLYELIWKRTIACQMSNAEFDSVSVNISVQDAVFHCVGTTRTFDGFMKVYIEDTDDEKDSKEIKLPELNINDKVNIESLNPEQHYTQPPARFTEASLVKKLEELGIGRPSTYATIMSTIVDRNYVEQDKQHRFHPTAGGWILSAYLNEYFTKLVNVNFTADTENALDDISNGKKEKIKTLSEFWNPTENLINSAKIIKTTDIINTINEFMKTHIEYLGFNKCPKCGKNLEIKLSKFGPFIGCSNYPSCNYTVKLNKDADNTNTESQNTDTKELGENIVFRVGKFGPYVSDGAKNASAKTYTAETITLEIAKNLLYTEKKKEEPIVIGTNPATDKTIYFYPSGKYGSYISSNKVNISVKSQPDLETAIDLINKKLSSKKGK
ncbi:MAG: type I DNA topoisomerase [Alphaproteobacteria bacterium]|nr:type I DNA topoisomerase [Alphaproteobacteria bacterium]